MTKDTNRYFFVLGRYPDLSTKEIRSVLTKIGYFWSIFYHTNEILIIDMAGEVDVLSLNKILGGTVKIGVILKELSLTQTFDDIQEYLTSDALFTDILAIKNEKVAFGISYYSENNSSYKIFVPQLLRTIKEHLKIQGFKPHFPRQTTKTLSSASVEKNNLLTTGAEVVLVETKDALLLGKTVSVQDFELFSKRDYGRPVRDMESGVMPPKLARMMLNLSQKNIDAALLDPFCGSGTVLQEALLLDFTDITGADKSEKAVSDTQQNIEWLIMEEKLTHKPEIVHSDVEELAKTTKKTFDLIVTEPYMGPNSKGLRNFDDMKKNKEELENLYLTSWKAFAKLLKKDGEVVMILPIFHYKNTYLKMDIIEKIPSLGFEHIALSEKRRKSLIIGNRYDFVLREIIHFRKI
ncbi:MAG: RsmD family RNA methyltransferase [Candidatus Levybacteria bacterium]|nr:RsmD family RNA methyltransferase [Candidatus Levybacteria bacterium]